MLPGFKKAGSIFIDSDSTPNFEITESEFKEKRGQVYAWVSGSGELLYVGKAGKGVNKRYGEHRAGWRGGSITGTRIAELIRETVTLHGPITVFAYTPETRTVIIEDPYYGKIESVIETWAKIEDLIVDEHKPAWNTVGK